MNTNNNTYNMLKILFPVTKNLQEVTDIINKYKDKFGLNTNLRLAHFLAQVREEVGENFKVLRENLNYKEETLSKYEIDPITKKKKKVGLFSNFTPELAEMYGRDEDTPVANQVAIANIAYANKLGNGEADSNKNNILDKDDDGWKYRGAGCLQITGKSNFIEVQKRCLKYAGVEANPDTLEGFILFGMGFWIWQDCYKAADGGMNDTNVDNVTSIINKFTKSYEHRRSYLKKIKHLI